MLPLPTRSLSVAITLCALLAGDGGSTAPAAPFADGMAEVRRLMERERWDEARALLGALLERHAGDVAVLEDLASVREDLRRCAFWSGFARPDPKTLISGEVLSYGPTSGKIKLRYAPEHLDDFDEHERLLLHPLTFDGDYSIELEWRPPHHVDGKEPLIAVGMGSDRTIGVTVGDQVTVVERYTISWSRVSIAPFTSRVKLTRKEDCVEVHVDGKRVEKVEFAPTDYGQILLVNADRLPPHARLTITGNAQLSWVQRLVDEAVRKAWKEFEAGYAIEQDLPRWILDAERGGGARVPLDYPGPRHPRQGGLWPKGLELVARGSPKRLRAFVEEKLPGDCTPVFRDYWGCWVEVLEGHLDAAAASVARVLAADPASVAARLLQIEVLSTRGARAEVEAALRALSTDHPTLVKATTMLAQQLMHERRTDEAREVVRRALEGGTPAVELAWIQSMLGKFVRGPEWSRTHVHESAHYRVRSDIDPQTCYDAARVLEAALRAYGRDLGKLAKGERRFDVYIFSGEAGYLAYVSDVLRSEPHNTAGLYTNTLEQLLIWNLPDRERMLQTVRHEGFHQYLDGLLDADQAPRWLNEGMAEYYEVHDLAAGDRERGVPHRENLQVLHYLRLPPLDEFIYLAPSEFYDPPTNYCVAWLLVHYLLHSNDRARGVFDDLMSRLAAGETRVEAVRGAFARFGAGELQSEAALHLTGLQRQSRR